MKQITYIKTYIWNLEIEYCWTYLHARNGDTDVENNLVARKIENGANWENSIDIHTWSCVKQIAREKLLYDTGSPVWSWDRQKVYIYISDQISHSVVSDSLRPHESQHAKPPCPTPTPRVHWDSRPSSQWCHPAISSSVVPFSSCPQSLPASGSFQMSQLFTWGGQSTRVSALASFLPKKSQGWSSEWTSWISLQSKGLSSVFSNTTVQKHQFFGAQPSSQSNSHIHTWLLEKP